ncbi:MAG: hypothetical protein WCK49_01650 [Myxococcaceae bacterium]
MTSLYRGSGTCIIGLTNLTGWAATRVLAAISLTKSDLIRTSVTNGSWVCTLAITATGELADASRITNPIIRATWVCETWVARDSRTMTAEKAQQHRTD